jgi:hypothetical protein
MAHPSCFEPPFPPPPPPLPQELNAIKKFGAPVATGNPQSPGDNVSWHIAQMQMHMGGKK